MPASRNKVMVRSLVFLLTLVIAVISLSACETADEDKTPSSDSGGSGNDDSTGDFGQWDNDDDDNNDSGADDDSHGDDDSWTDDDDNAECFFVQDFESKTYPPVGWTVINTNSYYEFNWTHTNYIKHSGNYATLVYAYAAPSTATSDELLYTGQIDLSDYSKAELTFWNFAGYGIFSGSFNPPALTVEVSYDAVNWTQLWNYPSSDWSDMLYYYGSWETLYQLDTIDLSAYSGELIWLGWRLNYVPPGDYTAYVWNMDDIMVCGTPVN